MYTVCAIVNSAALIWGGIADYRKSEIPDLVPITLMITGLLTAAYPGTRLGLMLVVAALLMVIDKLGVLEFPGGDFKLLCSLMVAIGLVQWLCTVLGYLLGFLLVTAIKHKPCSRHVPLCAYIAPAYLITNICLFI